MTRDEAKKLLPVIQAFVEGKVIEGRLGSHAWGEAPAPNFDPMWEWRIKLEPLECWVTEDVFGNRYVHRFVEDAETHMKFGENKPYTIHYLREVIE